MQQTLLASDLFALSQSSKNTGEDRCHWCGARCQRLIPHGDPRIPQIVVKDEKALQTSRCPNNAYTCTGCWIYHRKRVTIKFLGGRQADGKSLQDFSWYLTEQGLHTIEVSDYTLLYQKLLSPPLIFSLSLIHENSGPNLLQMAEANSLKEIRGTTELKFTLDNRQLTYSVYELEEALKHGSHGKMPGVRALVDFLGTYTLPVSNTGADDKQEGRGKGRPRKEEQKVNTSIKTIKGQD